MKTALPATLLIAGILSACATAKPVYTQDGRSGYTIQCSGAALSWASCQEKAGEMCGARGYDILSRDENQGTSVAVTQYAASAMPVINRSMIIACR